MAGFFERLRQGMTKTRTGLGDKIRALVGGRQWSDSLYDDLEEILYEADLGAQAVESILDQLRQRVRESRPERAEDVLDLLRQVMVSMLESMPNPYELTGTPAIWLMVGVNGTGKTTTAGKLAERMKRRGHSVILGAADTFRAAAAEQLMEWGRRAGVDVVHQVEGADPAAVAFDTVRAASARKLDLAVIDTAGRLHNKAHLMQELGKIARVVGRECPGAPHQVWLVIDATTGQNGLEQARVFQEAVNVTGIVLTKLDGTAKGGVAFAIHQALNIPIGFVGVGEKLDDLMTFDPEGYVRAILGMEEPH
ncbi:signal recognition particle-docking protein FtsY [Sulfobacillus harzensis]|uniref:Signal recognition particle receptor FtsY n=1 Tax=Sulfobacillus harzensis TaxID=2729629 RepID=A0A7Y0Q2A0_9FIRM|nr:signal recognition particle-docking protein FtsY [Sulfobacillus harzensis]NMP22968.1 signal recognition particle-docking protein FtsY [Sulfobacillus harzensis]